ncbi:MAG TPA: RecX family transcriptional regulator [Candidatus Saccharimonadales bacterium]|nr:RecX family transcriptional regulator [Candidatus Saccharimonadales bacterium]
MEEFEKYFNKALRFLSYRPRSEKEIRDNLKFKSRKSRKKADEVDEVIIDRIINQLKELKFVDDEQFTRWWIEQRSEFRPKSMRIIKMELKQKGIDQDTIVQVLQNPEFKVQNDLDKAKSLVQKQLRKYERFEPLERKQKLAQYLGRRGFDWETIKQAVDPVRNETEDESLGS